MFRKDKGVGKDKGVADKGVGSLCCGSSCWVASAGGGVILEAAEASLGEEPTLRPFDSHPLAPRSLP